MVITTGKPAAVRCARRPSHPNGHACRCHPSRSSGAGTRSPPKRGARAPVWRAPSSRAGVLAARARQCCTAAFPGSRGGASASFARANRGNGLRGASSVSQKQARNRRQSTQQHTALPVAQNALCGLVFRKACRIVLGLRQKSAQSKRRNESYVRLKKGSRFLYWNQQGEHGPDQSHKSPDFAVSKWRLQVPNFRIFSSLRMRADLNNFWWTWEPTRRTFKKVSCLFFLQNFFPNSQPKFLFVNSEIFSVKKKARCLFFESPPCWLPGPPKKYSNRPAS